MVKHVVKARELASWTGYHLGSQKGNTIDSVDARSSIVVITTRTPVDAGAKVERVELNWQTNVAVFGPA